MSIGATRGGRIPASNFLAARNTAEANQQDLQYLRDTFPITDRSLTPAPPRRESKIERERQQPNHHDAYRQEDRAFL
jgi:hypothetical protein